MGKEKTDKEKKFKESDYLKRLSDIGLHNYHRQFEDCQSLVKQAVSDQKLEPSDSFDVNFYISNRRSYLNGILSCIYRLGLIDEAAYDKEFERLDWFSYSNFFPEPEIKSFEELLA